ncbi:hypothetical protein ACHAXT_005090 [Thalassiosira profunda]
MPPPPSDTLAMPPVASRKRRRRPRQPSSPRLRSTSLLLALAAVASCLLHTSLPGFLIPPHYAAAKEITATREWQRLSENDTLPAGLHVRMDLSTGERWAKLPDDEDRDVDIKAIRDGHDDDDDDNGNRDNGEGEKAGRTEAVEVDAATGAVRVVEAATNSGGGPDGGNKSAANGGDDNSGNNHNNNNGEAPPHRDYDMMHRVMSRLPPDELARFGGLPALPSADAAAPSPTPTQLTGAQRDAWEQRMEKLWTARQAALARAQENVADLPSVLRERIATIEAYLGDATGGLASILAERRRADDNDGSSNKEEAGENNAGMANDILSALRDLAFQLSDVDLARDFRTLGGWAPLVSLLDEDLHLTAADDADELRAIADEVRALAATTIGTAVGNVGEFRPWALAEVTATEEGKEAASALSLLVSSFQQELAERSADMGDNTVAVASGSADRQTARATYKLRATYALGALLRGNPAAQRYFVAAGGAETLARDALGTVSAVRGPQIDESLTKLDWRFASKALALGEDVVADVALHPENYRDGGDDGQTKAAESAESAMTAGQLVAAFTTERWCDLSLRMLAPPTDVLGGAAARGIQERALGAVRQLAPGCLARAARAGDEGAWGADEVRAVRAGWQRKGDDDGADAGYRGELLALADAVLEGLQEQ